MRSGALRSASFRGVLVMGAGLLLLATLIAAPVFTQSSAAHTPFGTAAFSTLWSGIEPTVPNFWGPVVQPALMEPYREAANDSRLVQYFDKARMEQTTASGLVTNGLLTVELITGQRQMGDASFVPSPPSTLPVVGDPANVWPSYAAFGGTAFAAKVGKSGQPTGIVYKPDGTFGLNPGLGADPGAAFGAYQSDSGGKYAHNLPLAFSTYLAALPIPSLPVMGFPLTEAVWVNVTLKGAPTWVLVQPFERRVLSYTPSNQPGFQVEMGNIGQHYYQWRYVTNPDGATSPPAPGAESATMTATTASTAMTGTTAVATTTRTATPGTSVASTTTGTTKTKTPTRSASSVILSSTPGPLTISSIQLGTVTDTAFSLTFKTSFAATSEILYETTSHSYTSRQDISVTAAQNHMVTLTDLKPGTKYYFALHATTETASVEGKEDFFTTAGTVDRVTIPSSSTPTKTPKPFTPTPTDKATNTPTATDRATSTPKPPSSTATMQPKIVHVTLSHVVIGAGIDAQLAPSVIQLENATVALSLAYDGSSNTVTDTARPTDWVRDPTNATASSSTASTPLSLVDKQTTLTLTATVTIPFVDTTTSPLTVTFSRKISPSEYAAGMTMTSPPLSNAHSPGYNVVLSFSVALGG